MAESQDEQTVEQYLETLKMLLGGKLPDKIAKATLKATEGERTIQGVDAQSLSSATSTIHCEHVEDIEKKSSADLERAPLLYPPITTATLPLHPPPVHQPPSETYVRHVEQVEGCSQKPRYCPLLAVVKFPYKYIGQRHMQEVASAFFDGGKIWTREWDLYYIWSKEAPTDGPVIFVSETQFLSLINEINARFPDLNWNINEKAESAGLVVDFPHAQDGLVPLPLGKCSSRESYDRLRAGVDTMTLSSVQDKNTIAAFVESVELAAGAGQNKSKSRAHKQANVASKAQQMAQQLLSARRYLGLDVQPNSELSTDSGNTAGCEVNAEVIEDVILIAIDCESYEWDHNKVTEVGIATLDTRHLRDVSPGRCGETWRSRIRAKHFRISEYKHLVNKDFITGRPNNFEFGNSEDVSIKAIASTLTSCFKPPFESHKQGDAAASDEQEQRKIVLVGHDISQDIAYCHRLGFSVLNRSSLVEVLDTAAIFRAYSNEVDPRSLASIMLHFDTVAWNLHNAGNDAVYTLWALLAMCVVPYTAPHVADQHEHEEPL